VRRRKRPVHDEVLGVALIATAYAVWKLIVG